ncbi:50S ribosomal protein L4 [Methylomarinum sp. Ch1-1]|uniref:Large ribosomal subunit protein uL4 n=1 Tax=Methylomarinum roseum TaxID=3067653 RepID=A0AAU7NV27_9GAMM|nr:50S ribosomal protein L4 [Methylomarinum sp. Ch1-1]MDP4519051.1 50S ribosomal protein L4 [Methylomarinum sp. Ch1-1]
MTLQVPAISDQDSAAAVEVAEQVFGQEFNETLVHQLVVKYQAGARAGTKAQKNRSAVSGGGIKPFRQKGTGRARSGTIRSPLWRTGGVTFAAQPRSYTQKLNKKMYKAGIRSIFSELLRQERLVVSNDIVPTTVKTKEFFAKIKGLDAKRILLVADEINENLILATRNIPYVAVATADSVDPVALVSADKVIATSAALKQIEERLS